MREEDSRNLGRLLDPRTIAVVGGHPAEQAIRQSDRLGFDGRIWPVHPTRRSMAGRPVFGSLDDLPGVPDAAFVAVNRRLTLDIVRGLAGMGCGGAVLYASGFAEAGPEGAELQEGLIAGHDMALVGPNCYGTINALSGAVLWPDVQGCSRVNAGPALISQSGNIALNLTMNRRGVGFSHVIALGNQVSVTAEECLMYLAERTEVTAVGLYLESIIDPLAFGRAAIACREARTPVVVMRTGRTEQAGRITASHTAALSTPSEAYEALFERYGVIVVDSPAGFLTTLGFLHTVGPLAGNRLVSLSCSGGEAALVADRAIHYPVKFEPFTADHAARVEESLSAFSAVTNPLDYQTFIWGDPVALERCFEGVLAGPFDAALLVLDWPSDGSDDADWWPTLQAFESAVVTTGTPGLVAATLPENLPDRIREHATDRGLAVAYSIDEALAAAAAGAAVGRWFRTPPPSLHSSPVVPVGPPAATGTTLDEPTAKALLRMVGIAVPEGIVLEAPPSDASFQLPAPLRFPLVAKVVGPHHKSRRDGVVTGIRTTDDLAEAVKRLGGGNRPVLVEEQITGVVAELLVSIRHQAPIGQVLTVGAGGTLVELLADTANLLVPTSSRSLSHALAGLRIGRHLRESDGRMRIDPEMVAEVVDRLALLMADGRELMEIEINPLIITPDRAWAVDTLATAWTKHPTSGIRSRKYCVADPDFTLHTGTGSEHREPRTQSAKIARSDRNRGPTPTTTSSAPDASRQTHEGSVEAT